MDKIESLQQQVKLAQREGNKATEYTLLGKLGNAAFLEGNLALAQEAYERALQLAKTIDDLYGVGATLSNLGNVYIALGTPERAIEYCQEALAIAREIKDLTLEGNTLNNLGLAFYKSGRLSKAEEYFQEALAIAREIKDIMLEENARSNIDLGRAAGNLANNLDETRRMISKSTEESDREHFPEASLARRKQATLTSLRIIITILIITALAATSFFWILSREEIIPPIWGTILSIMLGGFGVVASLLSLVQMYSLRSKTPQVNEV